MASGFESNDSKKSLRASSFSYTPVGENVVGYMSAGEGFVGIRLEPEPELETFKFPTPMSEASYTVTCNVEIDEDLVDIFFPDRPEESLFWVEVEVPMHGPAKPRWNASPFVWWYYIKDYIQWRRDGRPEGYRKLIVPKGRILIGEKDDGC